MSDNIFPDNLMDGLRWLLGSVFVFVAGFEGYVMLFEGRVSAGIFSIVIAIVLAGIVVFWNRILGWRHALRPKMNLLVTDLRTWAAALITVLLAIIFSPLIEQQKWPFSLDPVTTMLGGTFLLVIGSVIGMVWDLSPKVRNLSPNKLSYLKDVHFYAGIDSSPTPINPRFVAKFARNGQRAIIYVEDRYLVWGTLGPSGLIHAPQVRVAEIKDFIVGDSVDASIVTPFENDGRRLWRWGPPTENPDPKTTFESSAWHQGRLVFLVDNAAPQYFYFIIDVAEMGALPNLIGQERFDFAQKWEMENEQQK